MEVDQIDLGRSLPWELWQHIFRQLRRTDLHPIRLVNKSLNDVVKYELLHRPRVRLIDTVLQVLVVGPGQSGHSMLVDVLAPDDKQCKRLLRPRDPNPQRPDPMRIQRLTLEDNNMINFFDIHGSQDRTAFIYASVSDVLLYVVHYAEPLQQHQIWTRHASLLCGCWFAMNATTASAVIAVNLDCTDSTQALDRFNKFKAEHVPRFEALLGVGIRIIPFCLTQTGATNTSAALGTYPWYSGDILSLLSTYFGERNNSVATFQRLAAQSLRLQFLFVKKAWGVGTLVAGRITSGVLRLRQSATLEPGQHVTQVRSLQRNGQDIDRAGPGDLVAASVFNVLCKDLSRRVGVMHSTEGALIQRTLALRARLRLVGSLKLQINHSYYLYHGTARIYCLLWWIQARDSIDVTRVSDNDKSTVHEQRRLARDLTAVDVILVPLVSCSVDRYECSEVYGDYRGRVMLVQQWRGATTLVASGFVQRVVNESVSALAQQYTASYYRALYHDILRRSSELFDRTEHDSHALFARHIVRNGKAKRAVQQPHRHYH